MLGTGRVIAEALMTDDEKLTLRRRDFWAGCVLLALAIFFLWRTSLLPFFKASAAGVSAEWYNSAALVPYGVFAILLALSLGLLTVAIRDGGAPWAGHQGRAFSVSGKVAAIAVILALYIFALVPRVDFTIASALIVTAMILSFHEGRTRPMLLSLGAVTVAGLYALIANFPQSEWTTPHDDDLVALACFVALAVAGYVEVRGRPGGRTGIALAAPTIGFVIPLLLVLAMAFGFRQNVPNRGGLLFSVIEYHYFVTLKPWLARD